QELRRRRVVTSPHSIHACSLHDLELSLCGTPVDGGPKCAEVVVKAHAVQLHRSSVQQEAFFFVEFDCANAEWIQITIQDRVLADHFAYQRVKIRVANAPPLRLGDRQSRMEGVRVGGGNRTRGLGQSDSASTRIQNRGLKFYAGSFSKFILNARLHRNGRTSVCRIGGRYVRAPVRYMHRSGDREPNIAVDTRSGIPTR